MFSKRVLVIRIFSRRTMSCVNDNPFYKVWTTPYGIPPFSEIKIEHYKPAILRGFQNHLDDVKKIATNTESASFENTIVALDRAGLDLEKVLNVFQNQTLSNSPTDLQEVEMELSAPLAEHTNSIVTFPGLFQRVDEVYSQLKSGSLSLSSEESRLTERTHIFFVRAGAKFDASAQKRYKEISMRLAELNTKFAQNILKDESEFTLEIFEEKGDFSGLPSDLVASARQVGVAKGKSGCHLVTLSRSMVEPFLTYADKRELREELWKSWVKRGIMNPERDNRATITETLQLRLEQARMHGYKTYAEFSTSDSMALNPTRVMDLLEKVWQPAKSVCAREQAALESFIRDHGFGEAVSKLEPWDWRYFAEKIRQEKYNLDASEVKPYFPLNHMVEAIFDCANRLFGLRFILRSDIVSYHPDVQTYEVKETVNGVERLVAVFIHDNFSRANKQGGAWMSEYRSQHRNVNDEWFARYPETSASNGSVIPIIVNNNNFSKAPEGEQTLLSFDDARTLFHEFGHGLHGMLSNVTFKKLAGTSVLRDFVELPSQLYEHWLGEREVLKKHALHYATKEAIPDVLIDRLEAARGFNSGYDTISYTSSALVDQALHNMTAVPEDFDVLSFGDQTMAKLGMINVVGFRHHPVHFMHIFSSDSYAAAYYVYLWAEVLDADGFDAFKETGNIFDKDVAHRVREYIYSAGNVRAPGDAYRLFRGRDPTIDAMLKKKSLV